MHRSVKAVAVLFALLVVSGCRSSRESTAVQKASLTPQQTQANVASFDLMWNEINSKHYDPSFAGVDWAKVKADYRPKVESAKTMQQARSAMTGALGELHLSHFAVIPSDAFAGLPGTQPSGNATSKPTIGDVGLTIRLIEGKLVVTRVRAGSPADQQGVRPGSVIDRIGDKPAKQVLAKLKDAAHDDRAYAALAARVSEGAMHAPIGETIKLRILSEKKRSDVELVTVPIPGRAVSLGNLPPMQLEINRQQIQRDGRQIGYFALSIFLDPATVNEEFASFIRENQQSPGIVIDLRGNPGGLGAMAMGMTGFLVQEQGLLIGTMKMRTGEVKMNINPRTPRYDGKVAVLIDELSTSTSEFMAGGLQDLKRARVFGQQSNGAALPSVVVKLPNDDRLQYAIADYVSASGKRLEGDGVTPDETIKLSRRALLRGEDQTLDAALEWIEKSAPTTMP